MDRRTWSRYAPDTLPRPPHWSQAAACRSAPLDLFYPEGDAGAVCVQTREAKSWCARCVVQERCLADAMARGERWGVWGGLDEDERRRILRRRRKRERAARRREEQKREEAAGAFPAEGPSGAPAA